MSNNIFAKEEIEILYTFYNLRKLRPELSDIAIIEIIFKDHDFERKDIQSSVDKANRLGEKGLKLHFFDKKAKFNPDVFSAVEKDLFYHYSILKNKRVGLSIADIILKISEYFCIEDSFIALVAAKGEALIQNGTFSENEIKSFNSGIIDNLKKELFPIKIPEAFFEGVNAFIADLSLEDDPYQYSEIKQSKYWTRGWKKAVKLAQEQKIKKNKSNIIKDEIKLPIIHNNEVRMSSNGYNRVNRVVSSGLKFGSIFIVAGIILGLIGYPVNIFGILMSGLVGFAVGIVSALI